MKKNLSIIASLLLSTSLFGDNLEDAFKNLKVNGEIKSVYVDSNFLGNIKSDDISAIGGNLGVQTDTFYGLSAGTTFQISHVLNDDLNNTTNSRVNNFNASESVLSEAFLNYKLSNTSIKAGRQFINTPLVSSGIDGKSSESIIKDSYEAYIVTNTDIPNTTVMGGYIDKYQSPTSSNGNIGKFENIEDGAYTILLKNNSLENLTLQGQYLDINGIQAANDKDALYFQADYQLSTQTLSAQYLSSNNGTSDGELYGAKATGPLGIWKLGYLAAYTSSTNNTGDIYNGIGEGVTDTPFTAMPVHGGGVPSRADTDTVVGAIVIPILDTKLIPYAGKSFSKTHVLGDVSAVGSMFIYPIAKGLLFKAEYEHVEVEKIITENTDTSRVYLSYKF